MGGGGGGGWGGWGGGGGCWDKVEIRRFETGWEWPEAKWKVLGQGRTNQGSNGEG